MVRPFKQNLLNDACPISDIMSELQSQLQELAAFKMQETQSGLTMKAS